MLSREAIQEFKVICSEEFGIKLSDENANSTADSIVAFFETLIKIRNENEY